MKIVIFYVTLSLILLEVHSLSVLRKSLIGPEDAQQNNINAPIQQNNINAPIHQNNINEPIHNNEPIHQNNINEPIQQSNRILNKKRYRNSKELEDNVKFYKTIDCHSHNQCLDKFKEVAKAYSKKVSSSVYEKNQKDGDFQLIRGVGALFQEGKGYISIYKIKKYYKKGNHIEMNFLSFVKKEYELSIWGSIFLYVPLSPCKLCITNFELFLSKFKKIDIIFFYSVEHSKDDNNYLSKFLLKLNGIDSTTATFSKCLEKDAKSLDNNEENKCFNNFYQLFLDNRMNKRLQLFKLK